MTDKEITEIIATKVMGWDAILDDGVPQWGINEYDFIWQEEFTPLTSDADCMMAWDKFVEKRQGCFHLDTLAAAEHLLFYIGAGRRMAMCECMVKAVAV